MVSPPSKTEWSKTIMATENNEEKEVKEFVETVNIEGKGGNTDDDDETVADDTEGSSPTETSDDDEDESDDDTDTSKKDAIVQKKPADDAKDEDDDGLAEVADETPRERALRLEVTRLRNLGKGERKGELGIRTPAAQQKQEMSPERKKVLEKYKPEDLATLKEVFDVMAEDMGFVRKDQLGASTYQEKAGEELDKFIEAHPEYLPENDKDNVLWGRFKEEYGLYKQPENPKDFKKIFEKVHRDVFGIKPAGDNKTINASKEKIKVASHSGASKPAPQQQRAKAPAGVRLDMLKGFTEEEIAELGK